MEKYILTIDQGTTSSRCILFNKKGEIVVKTQKEFPQHYPNPGWIEHNPLEIWNSVVEVVVEAFISSNISYEEVEAIGITNQRETTIIWDKKTGVPIYPAIVWQSKQTLDICEEWSPYEDTIHKKTGLIMNPYFSASKIKFILDHVEGSYERAKKGELCFGTVDSWLIYKLTGNKEHKTDITNASRTMLFNIHTLTWDQELLDLFQIPKEILPEVCDSDAFFGEAVSLFPMKTGCHIPIRGVLGDQQSSLFGQCAFQKGEAKNTYGTGCFMLLNTGESPVISTEGLLTTIAWKSKNKVCYALEGSVLVGGASIQWLRDQMSFIKNATDTEKYALSISSSEGVYVVPAFVGLGTPYWDNEARGTILGISRGTRKEHIIRATLESIAYQSLDVFSAMEENSGVKLKSLYVDGGAASNNFLMQFQSDISDCEIKRPFNVETTALGVCFMAGLSSGFFKDQEELKQIKKECTIFKPSISSEKREELVRGWEIAIQATRLFKLGGTKNDL